MWYGKGPGVDRTGDVFRHANFAGTSQARRRAGADGRRPHRGILDHRAPVRIPLRRRDDPDPEPGRACRKILDYGLYGWAMSRFTGTWVALKCDARDRRVDRRRSTAASTASTSSCPTDFAMPEGGLNIRLGDPILAQEARLHDYKRDAMLAFVRANKLNRIITSGGRNPKIGIITAGKSYLDVRQAFDELGIDEVKCNDLGMRLYKVGCPWPLSPARAEGIRRRASISSSWSRRSAR